MKQYALYGHANRAQLKVRLLEPLRRQIEEAAFNNSRSMNLEIVTRLETSFKTDNHDETWRWPS